MGARGQAWLAWRAAEWAQRGAFHDVRSERSLFTLRFVFSHRAEPLHTPLRLHNTHTERSLFTLRFVFTHRAEPLHTPLRLHTPSGASLPYHASAMSARATSSARC
jgi:hypothetical protein